MNAFLLDGGLPFSMAAGLGINLILKCHEEMDNTVQGFLRSPGTHCLTQEKEGCSWCLLGLKVAPLGDAHPYVQEMWPKFDKQQSKLPSFCPCSLFLANSLANSWLLTVDLHNA